jgi:hypothetical protein
MNLFKAMLAWLLLTQTAVLAEAEMSLRGPGALTCGQFGKMYADDPHRAETMFFSWAQGYWSAQNSNLNQHQYRDLAGSTDAQRGALRSYCDKHPLATYLEATEVVFRSFPLKEDTKQ